MAAEAGGEHGRIVRDPEILVGKAVVRGTRIPVELVLAKLATNPGLEALFEDYPRLTVEHVKACLEYVSSMVGMPADEHAADLNRFIVVTPGRIRVD